MSRLQLEQPLYEAGYLPQQTIILDADTHGSPNTATLRYEEAVARGHGGEDKGLMSSRSPHLPLMSFKPHSSLTSGYPDVGYADYSHVQFHHRSSHGSNDAAAHINQLAFATNNAASAPVDQILYRNLDALSPGMTFLGLNPRNGASGTKVCLKISCAYELLNVTDSLPYVAVFFGAQRRQADIIKDSQDVNGIRYYSIITAAPSYNPDGWQPITSEVELSVVVETAEGRELARVSEAGLFTYDDLPRHTALNDSAGAADVVSESNQSPEQPESDLETNSPPSLTIRTSATTSPTIEHHSSHTICRNTADVIYGYDAAAALADSQGAQTIQAQQSHQSLHERAGPGTVSSTTLVATDYGQPGAESMLQGYRTSNYHSPYYGRATSSRRSSLGAWAHYGASDSHTNSGYAVNNYRHAPLARPGSMRSLAIPNGVSPSLVRTTSLTQSFAGMDASVPGYNSFPFQTSQAILSVQGDLNSMGQTQDWTAEERQTRRRIVLFKKSQVGNCLNTSFRPVPVNERPPNSICVSCIYWAERHECYITSVDTISLLEQLIAAPEKFSVEEKNRIRRNLEGFKPETVSKAKKESEDFFKLIMNFGNPKPRNIEKDVKVFAWKILELALGKIISKYSVYSSASSLSSTASQLRMPMSHSNLGYLPPTPASLTSATDSASAVGYLQTGMTSHAPSSDSVPSPRSQGVGVMLPAWSTYSTRDFNRPMSPTNSTRGAAIGQHTPLGGTRSTVLPPVYDDKLSHGRLSSAYFDQSQHESQAQASSLAMPHVSRWEYPTSATSVSNPYDSTQGQYSGYGTAHSSRS